MPRLIYNRVAKTGSTTMVAILSVLANMNHFKLVYDDQIFPNQTALTAKLLSLPENAVYTNHCNYVSGLPEDYTWINIVRDPVELEVSMFYYSVTAYRGARAVEELDRRKTDPCGCLNMEFDACVKSYMTNEACSYRLNFNHSVVPYFSEAAPYNWPDIFHTSYPNFTAQMAYKRVRDDYAFVGLQEEFELTVLALEHLLPRFFANATQVLRNHKKSSDGKLHINKTAQKNPVTGTVMTGAISSHARDALVKQNADDMAFVENVRRLFWWKITKLFPDMIPVPFAHQPYD